MCEKQVLALLLAVAVFVTASPVNPYLRGTHYTIDNPQENHHVRKPYLEVRNSTYHGAGPREEARAMCSVRTQEVNATANATITRRLHGVVTSRELHSAIQRLELIIFGQMQQLWQSLDAIRNQIGGIQVFSQLVQPDNSDAIEDVDDDDEEKARQATGRRNFKALP